MISNHFSEKKEPVITCGIYLFNTKNRKILICHATHSAWNKWTIPKGIKGNAEDAFKAASRELKEETGININALHILKKYSLALVKYQKQNKILESFLVITDSDLNNHVFSCYTFVNNEFPEIDGWKWIRAGVIKKHLHESQLKNFNEINELIKIQAV